MKYLFFLIFVSAILFVSCDKTKDDVIQTTGSNSNSLLKFVNAYTALTPSGTATPTGPSVDLYINDKKINAGPIGYGSVFPTSAGYASLPFNSSTGTNFKVVLNRAGVSTPNSDILYQANYDFGFGSYTTIYLVDTLPYTNPSSPIIFSTNDKVVAAKPEFHKIRFANMIPSTDTLEIFSKNLQTVLLPGTRFKNSTDFFELPVQRKNDTLQLRKVGTTLLLAELRAFNPTSERVYTVYSRGQIGAVTGIRARTLASYTNK